MASINSRVVYQSQAMRMTGNELPFEYLELMKLPSSISKPGSWAISALSGAFKKFGRHPIGREILERIGPKAGEGPSKEMQDSGFFKAHLLAYAGPELVADCEFSYAGDPGNKATVLFACESAFCLIFDSAQPLKAGGFWTPSTALGDVLLNRLLAAGVKLKENRQTLRSRS